MILSGSKILSFSFSYYLTNTWNKEKTNVFKVSYEVLSTKLALVIFAHLPHIPLMKKLLSIYFSFFWHYTMYFIWSVMPICIYHFLYTDIWKRKMVLLVVFFWSSSTRENLHANFNFSFQLQHNKTQNSVAGMLLTDLYVTIAKCLTACLFWKSI